MGKKDHSRTKPQRWLSELVHNMQRISIRSRNKKLYRSTLSKRKIRLLTILPSGKDLQLPLACELQECFMDSAPEYEALSYCWGDSTNQRDIICNGYTCSVTTNLHEALTRLRLEDEPRVIWADAICINQSNNEEKSFQVSSMSRVFATAKRVVVWLGQAEKSHVLQIEKVMEDLQKDFQSSGDSMDDDTIIGRMIVAGSPLKMYNSLPWNAVSALFCSPWFERTWVIQEIRLATEAIIYWGEGQIYWKNIAKLGMWIAAEVIAGRMSPIDGYLEHAVMMATKLEVEQECRLLNALSNFQGSIASDPRDNVYGILGLPELDEERHMVTVDYAIPVADLYNEVAVTIIRQTENLQVFQYVRHPPLYDGESEFMSWTPRWDENSIPSLIRNDRALLRPHFQFDLPHIRFENIRKNKKALSLKGLRFDVVSRVDRIPELGVASSTSLSQTEDSQSEFDTHPFIQYWYRHVSQDPPSLTSDHPTIMTLAHTITAGKVTADFTAHWDMGEDECKAYLQSFLVYINSIYNEKPGQLELGHTVVTEPDDRGTLFKMLAGHFCDDRALFECSNGSYGIGPDCLREGDLIVQLEGGLTPHALRQRNEGYLLLGQVYLHSIMNGELVTLMEEGEIQAQEFRLI